MPATERMIIAAISTTTTTTAAMAFLFFNKRRRDGLPPAPDEALAADARRMATTSSADAAMGMGTNRGAGTTLGIPADELAMPRWRRPSLMAARKSDPLRYGSTEVRLSFEHGLVGPIEGRERRRIRYRVVRLLDAPDELRSSEIGALDEGDEVQLLERSGAYWLVLCPDGGRGWVHRMTLDDAVDEGAASADRSFAEATDDLAPDLLQTYLRIRGQEA
ncbi:MAG: SH3 domain-containing protein [Chloroflexi bacterium]|nr:SH3 domain-containing protein [Chloroflexota bacterium]